MWEIGASTSGHKTVGRELFEEYAKAGLKKMEVSVKYNGLSPDKCYEIFKMLDINELKKLALKTGVEIWSYHLPFGNFSFNPASFDQKVRDDTIAIDNEMIRTAAQMGAKAAVVHASSEPISDKDREKSMEYSKEVIAILNETAKANGIILAVENLPRTCLGKNSAEMKEILEIDKSVMVCFDVNHLLEETHRDFIKSIGDRIVTLHISDYDFIDERHQVPGKGKIDWKELVGLLEEIKYKGPFMNEVDAVCEKDKKNGDVTYSELYKANAELLSACCLE